MRHYHMNMTNMNANETCKIDKCFEYASFGNIQNSCSNFIFYFLFSFFYSSFSLLYLKTNRYTPSFACHGDWNQLMLMEYAISCVFYLIMTLCLCVCGISWHSWNFKCVSFITYLVCHTFFVSIFYLSCIHGWKIFGGYVCVCVSDGI